MHPRERTGERPATVTCPYCPSTEFLFRTEGTGCFVTLIVGFLVLLGFFCIIGPFALPLAFVTCLLMVLLGGKQRVRCCRGCGARTAV